MRSIFFLFAFSLFLNASTITLNEIIQELKQKHPAAMSLKAHENAAVLETKALSSKKASVLSYQGAYTRPSLERSGYEYGIGIEQNIANPNVKKNMLRSLSYMNEAQIMEFKSDFLLLLNEISYLYHSNCLDIKSADEYKRSVLAFEALYEKKKKAYMYKEISKKELLMLELELKRLKNEYRHYMDEIEVSRADLNSRTLLGSLKSKELSCKDIRIIDKEPALEKVNESLKELSFDKRIQSLQSEYGRYDSLFDSFTINASYENELDTDRFLLGVSLPLNFTTSLNEQKKAHVMQKKSALKYEREAYTLKKNSQIDMLRNKLSQNFEDISALESILQRYEGELMPLVESAYRLGEDSAIEYLLGRQEMWRLKKELTQYQKKYYRTLFELYGVLERTE